MTIPPQKLARKMGLPWSNNANGYSYAINGLSTASAGVLTMAGVDGNNGGWAAFFGSDPIRPDGISLVIDEDQLKDSERSHTTEQVGYLIFE